MSKDRLAGSAMTAERAQDLVLHIVTERARWGKQYNGDDILIGDLLDALVFAAQEENEDTRILRASLKLANKQLAAAKARETRMKTTNADLRDQIKVLVLGGDL